jgi:hypothetical protein
MLVGQTELKIQHQLTRTRKDVYKHYVNVVGVKRQDRFNCVWYMDHFLGPMTGRPNTRRRKDSAETNWAGKTHVSGTVPTPILASKETQTRPNESCYPAQQSPNSVGALRASQTNARSCCWCTSSASPPGRHRRPCTSSYYLRRTPPRDGSRVRTLARPIRAPFVGRKRKELRFRA